MGARERGEGPCSSFVNVAIQLIVLLVEIFDLSQCSLQENGHIFFLFSSLLELFSHLFDDQTVLFINLMFNA
jgi:hypothetical protein